MATRYGKLPFDDAPRVRVFRAIDDLLRADDDLKRVLSRPGAFLSWQGKPEDKKDFAQTTAPAVRITPAPSAENYWFPGYSKGDLVIQVEMLVAGLVSDDVDNLFYALVQAIAPLGDQARLLAIHNKLKAAGAVTGIVFVSQPAYDADPQAGSDGQFRAVGAIRLEVQTS